MESNSFDDKELGYTVKSSLLKILIDKRFDDTYNENGDSRS